MDDASAWMLHEVSVVPFEDSEFLIGAGGRKMKKINISSLMKILAKIISYLSRFIYYPCLMFFISIKNEKIKTFSY